ncbi:peptide chain release factor N(5)-glutamine methyltransferase [Xinfangfangia sp. D13-10-4-6]|uniref:peptide chain release factor N(5)-glutamine methyltransferase n=1 Tax=Pseudogemmobacter hezensis TaxID=2737662 RepID=UPI00155514E6|nr:peptide chain release factor N(5)-glutamine methyltransferase [Pseudogemmobacter hezensis]NPD15840.1 peptide chain release factor N(5)-glutamine methyltransferase [Pseudogemmobacter hezensis]
MSAKLALIPAIARLRDAGVEDPARDARILLAHAMGIGADRLTLHLTDPLQAPAAARFEAAIADRAARRPVSQIIGSRLFYGRRFIVTADTLDPRPETEILIEEALRAPFDTVLDIGTGTGAILLTLLAERPQAQGMGSDLSAAALAVAGRNAGALDLSPRARFQQTSWLEGVSGRFDLIVSNPPYIALAEMAGLEPEVREHEPHLALTDGADGLTAYREITAQAPEHLAPGGRLIFEIGFAQGQAVAWLMADAGLRDIRVIADLAGHDRVVCGCL